MCGKTGVVCECQQGYALICSATSYCVHNRYCLWDSIDKCGCSWHIGALTKQAVPAKEHLTTQVPVQTAASLTKVLHVTNYDAHTHCSTLDMLLHQAKAGCAPTGAVSCCLLCPSFSLVFSYVFFSKDTGSLPSARAGCMFSTTAASGSHLQ